MKPHANSSAKTPSPENDLLRSFRRSLIDLVDDFVEQGLPIHDAVEETEMLVSEFWERTS